MPKKVNAELTYAVNSTIEPCRPMIRFNRATRSSFDSRMIRVDRTSREPSSVIASSSERAVWTALTYVIGNDAMKSTMNHVRR